MITRNLKSTGLSITHSLLIVATIASSALGAGSPWAQNGVSVSASENSKMFPSITAVGDGAGSSFIAWEGYESAASTNGDIFVQKIDVNGRYLFSSDKNAAMTTSSAKRFPSIVKDGTGGAFVVWEDDRNGASNTDIYIQRIDANGDRLWSEDKVVCNAAGEQRFPQIALVSNGNAVIVWEDRRGDLARIYAQKFDVNGSAQWTANGIEVAPYVSVIGGEDQFSPAVAPDGSGGAIAVWEDYRVDGFTADIFGKRIDSSGATVAPWSNAGDIISNSAPTAADHWFPSIAGDGGGNFVVAWEDYRDDPDSISPNIYIKGIQADKTALFADKAVSLNTADQRFPRVAFSTGENSFIVVWEDYRAGYSSADIYAQKVNPATGVLVWGSEAVVSNANSVQDAPVISSSDLKGAVAAWEDFREGSNIYALALPIPGSVMMGEDEPLTGSIDIILTLWGTSIDGAAVQMSFSDDGISYSAWEAFAVSKAKTLSIGDGIKKVYVKFKDSSGNESPAYFMEIEYNSSPDINGSIKINNGADSTNSVNVTIKISVINAEKMRFSNDAVTWSDWEEYATSKAWTLISGSGTKTVYAQFQDALGDTATKDDAITLSEGTGGPIVISGIGSPGLIFPYTVLDASWGDFSESGYLVAIGTAPKTPDVNILDWSSVDVDQNKCTLDLQNILPADSFGKVYYLSVKSDNSQDTRVYTTPFLYVPGDVSSKSGQGDGKVDGFDLGRLGIQFGTTGSNVGADLNRDGTVNGLDLTILGVNFGKVKQ